ncbi:uncharacterized protein LOC107851167 [Capsicum annuum]|uniref:uncharacterized protein LOC107851167 n=1 Tax=Capsicum annuum TaxID=4072 RepID=UPI001FB06E9B|nr:uncharacterized protein LOC107851167 [Capsicum annuum]
MRNHESRLAGTAPFTEVNAVKFLPTKRERSPDPSHGCGRYFNQGDRLAINNNPQYQQCKKKGEAPETAPRTNYESKCYLCGGKGHWSRPCCTPKHLVKLCQATLKKAEKDVEENFLFEDNTEPINLEVSDFFVVPEEHVNQSVGDNYELV